MERSLKIDLSKLTLVGGVAHTGQFTHHRRAQHIQIVSILRKLSILSETFIIFFVAGLGFIFFNKSSACVSEIPVYLVDF